MAFVKSFIGQITLYKYRYIIGYMAIIALLIAVITVDINSLPNGVSEPEMNSAVTSMRLEQNLSLDWIINAPHHLIQQISIKMLGLSRASLVAPSVIFALLTILLFNLTLRRWFSRSISIIATLVASTSGAFMLLARSGTPDIMLPFWTVLFVFAGVGFLVNHEKGFFWKLLIVFAGIGLVYTPYGIYTLLACLLGGIIHPHIRSRLKHIKRSRLAILSVVSLLALIPLVILLFQNPSQAVALTGLNHLPNSWGGIRANLANVIGLYLGFGGSNIAGTVVTPVFNIASAILVLYGLFLVIKDHHTARSYVMIAWVAATSLVVVFLSQMPHIIIMPAMFLLAFGTKGIITEWYSLFPLNPYARIAGLVPLALLMLGIAGSNLSHYFNSFRYIPSPAYSASLSAVKQSAKIEGNRAITVVTSRETQHFYEILKQSYPQMTVTNELPETITQPTLVLPNTNMSYTNKSPSRIFVTWSQQDNVVLRVYRP